MARRRAGAHLRRAPGDRYSDEIIAAEQGDGPQPALRFIVLSVVLLDEGAGLVGA